MIGDLFDEVDGNEFSSSSSSNNYYNNNTRSHSKRNIPKPPATRNNESFVGLLNQGNTCYLNSLIQTIYMTPEMRIAIDNLSDECLRLEPFTADISTTATTNENNNSNNKKKTKERVIAVQLQRLFGYLTLSDRFAVTTESLTKSFGWTNNEEFQQHDVQELNRVLFDALKMSLKGTEAEDLVDSLYKGHITNYIKCLECNYVSERGEDFYDLPLIIRNCRNIYDSFHLLLNVELLEKDNRYFCSHCNKKVDAEKGIFFTSLPPILTFPIMRFEYDFNLDKRVKLSEEFEFPVMLDTTMCVNSNINHPPSPPQPSEINVENNIYELLSVVIHRGGAYGGHYHAIISDLFSHNSCNNNTINNTEDHKGSIAIDIDEFQKKIDGEERVGRGKWYNFDDSRVSPILEAALKKQYGGHAGECAYILVYRKKNLGYPVDYAGKTSVKERWQHEIRLDNEKIEKERIRYQNAMNQIQVNVYSDSTILVDDDGLATLKSATLINSLKLSAKINKKDKKIVVFGAEDGSFGNDLFTADKLSNRHINMLYLYIDKSHSFDDVKTIVDEARKYFVVDGEINKNDSEAEIITEMEIKGYDKRLFFNTTASDKWKNTVNSNMDDICFLAWNGHDINGKIINRLGINVTVNVEFSGETIQISLHDASTLSDLLKLVNGIFKIPIDKKIEVWRKIRHQKEVLYDGSINTGDNNNNNNNNNNNDNRLKKTLFEYSVIDNSTIYISIDEQQETKSQSKPQSKLANNSDNDDDNNNNIIILVKNELGNDKLWHEISSKSNGTISLTELKQLILTHFATSGLSNFDDVDILQILNNDLNIAKLIQSNSNKTNNNDNENRENDNINISDDKNRFILKKAIDVAANSSPNINGGANGGANSDIENVVRIGYVFSERKDTDIIINIPYNKNRTFLQLKQEAIARFNLSTDVDNMKLRSSDVWDQPSKIIEYENATLDMEGVKPMDLLWLEDGGLSIKGQIIVHFRFPADSALSSYEYDSNNSSNKSNDDNNIDDGNSKRKEFPLPHLQVPIPNLSNEFELESLEKSQQQQHVSSSRNRFSVPLYYSDFAEKYVNVNFNMKKPMSVSLEKLNCILSEKIVGLYVYVPEKQRNYGISQISTLKRLTSKLKNNDSKNIRIYMANEELWKKIVTNEEDGFETSFHRSFVFIDFHPLKVSSSSSAAKNFNATGNLNYDIIHSVLVDQGISLIELKKLVLTDDLVSKYIPNRDIESFRLWDDHRLLKTENSSLKTLRVTDKKVLTIEVLKPFPKPPKTIGKFGVVIFIQQRISSVSAFTQPLSLVLDDTEFISFLKLKQTVVEIFGIAIEDQLLAKYVNHTESWVALNGDDAVNLRAKPFFFKDGDTIAVKNVKWDEQKTDDFDGLLSTSTTTSTMGSNAKATKDKIKFIKPVRVAEASIKISVEDYGDYDFDDD